ncbi:myosin phosphatase Rho-interacting protein isoform X3 [Choloepus didactylus]|uniref:myosin phosphatase Rho-interacting protein isoform X3 n=1 Tax=Choloepus didactylus TaxID=27675 RepID=UPI00189EF562|nr:myosin phosphatase Rho-interacting protein isoform X3 [Choloepus didactylus]
MSAAKENPCRKFQANIFNKSKCQNCFKPRESHLLSDEDLTQAKPIYGGWLLLAPDGTDFDNPVHRSRKWQRRFFILYEHGLLRYALDEMPTTLPQGTINMNQCSDVVDAEGRTGQKFSLCILTPEKEHFIRAENKEIISGWLEMLMVYPRTNKQNQKKKRKVEPPTPQGPGPAKVAVTSSSSIPSAEKVPPSKATLWQEEVRAKDQSEGSSRSPVQSPGQGQPPATGTTREPGLESREEDSAMASERMACGRKVRAESGYFSLEKTRQDLTAEEEQLPPPLSPPSPSTPNRRYSHPKSPRQEMGRPLPPPGPRAASRRVCSVSLSSADAAGRPPAPLDASTGVQGAATPGCSPAFRAGWQYATLADVPRAVRISHREAFQAERRRLERRARARSPGREEVARLFGNERRRSQVIEKFEALDVERAEHMETSLPAGPMTGDDGRQGRSEKRVFPRRRDVTVEASTAPLPDTAATPLSPQRRAKSLDRRSSEPSATPDLLNFKKGWLTKQYEDGQWKKHWFVLADQSLRFYRDSAAEEAADLDGEIDLSTCVDVTECPVQRNYGFQVHTKEGAFTLSAMTSGIRRNWMQTIRKHVHPAAAPDVTSSLPEEKDKSSSSPESSPRPREVQEPGPGEPEAEPRRSRARERRREGRSKTFDWAEFRPSQQALTQGAPGELERERARRREERRKRFGMPDAADGQSADDPGLRMDVDRSPGPPGATDTPAPSVHAEIEQRWLQVETTPLREERQVPIAPLRLPGEDGGGRLPPHALTALLEKELEQSQKEASDLLEQNRLLRDQLRVALGREQSAREGYVLQTEVATSPSGAWQRLHKVNQDLQSELEAQCQRQELISRQIQALKRSHGEAKDVIRHHEAEIQGLRARLGNAATELAAKEQALAKLRSDLQQERDKGREQLEEWRHSEATLSGQLQASEQQLQGAEARLLEKTQELRGLEVQQALQRDRQKEVQRLQERIAELGRQLSASEQAQRLAEEKLQQNYGLLLESCEGEKQVLLQSLKEAEDKARAYEDRLQGHEQQVEALQKERLSARLEGSEMVRQLEEQLEAKEAGIRKLAEHIQSLRGERDLSRQRVQELTEQVAASDRALADLREVLQGREAAYHSLESAHRDASGQLRVTHARLQEKEDELARIKELHEALVKVAARGSSSEEAEAKLQAEGESVRKSADASSKDTGGPRTTLEVQDGGQQPQAAGTPLGPPQPRLEDEDPGAGLGEEGGAGSPSGEAGTEPPASGEGPNKEGLPQGTARPDQGLPGVKRQRIRFSTIQCHRYIHADGSEKAWASSTSPDTSQDRSPSEDSMSLEPAPGMLPGAGDPETYVSIIHALETKLYVTEEKLKDVTMKLEGQQGQNQEALAALHHQWAGTEAQLREQLQASLAQVSTLASQLEQEGRERAQGAGDHCRELKDFQRKNSQALTFLGNCREQLRALLQPGQEEEAGSCRASLASVEGFVVGAMQALQSPLAPADGTPQAQLEEGSSGDEGKSASQGQPREPVLTEQEQLKLLSEQIALEASLINQIANSLKNTTSDVSRVLREISQSGKSLLESESATARPGTAADTLAEKLLVDREFWSQVESLSKHLGAPGAEAAGAPEAGWLDLPRALDPALAGAMLIRAELSFVAQSVSESFHQRLRRVQENLQGTKVALEQHKRLLGQLLEAYQTPDFERAIQQASEALGPPAGAAEGVQPPWGASPAGDAPSSEPGSSPVPSRSPEPGPGTLAAVQEELARQLEEKARLLGEISAALASLPPGEPVPGCQRLLQVSRACSGGLGRYSSSLVQDAVLQAQVCYAACRVRLQHEQELRLLRDAAGRGQAPDALREEYEVPLRTQRSMYLEAMALVQREDAELKAGSAQLEGAEEEMGCEAGAPGLGGLRDTARHHLEQMQTLENRFQLKVRELQVIHEEELRAFQEHHTQSLQSLREALRCCRAQPPPALQPPGTAQGPDPAPGLRERVQELEAQTFVMREELELRGLEGGAAALREKYRKDLENLKATCERGFAAMEETHQKKIEDLQRQHQRELEKLREEKDRLLAEETAATISAIEAVKNAHREELERELEKSQRSQISSVNADIEALRRQYVREELRSVQRELEVLSEQYSQKCLENAHLAQALEAERQALRQCQRENQELNAHNQELNNRLAAEITRLRTLLTGDGGGEAASSPLTQGKDAYELEVLLRVKESEIQYLKQEIGSLKDELQTALRDKKYASDKYKDIYTELSIVKAKADCDISRLREQLKAATEALGEKPPESPPVPGYDIMKSKSNPDFLKKDTSCVSRQLRNIRSKSVIEQVSWDN